MGEEITTSDGELIGLFLKRLVPRGLSAVETAVSVKDQGGLIYLEHPYDQYRRHLSESAIETIADLIDIVEVFNGRSDERTNLHAEELRQTLGVPAGAGSDAHSLSELGSVYLEMDDFDGPSDFLAKLSRAQIVKRRHNIFRTARALLRPKYRG
jgi:predicted metal-dependent phosphoesterase TrpH